MVFSQSYLVDQYTEIKGLPTSVVFDITQDRSGYMWFATRSGIVRYDGFNWAQFSITEGLPLSSFNYIRGDSRDGIWGLSTVGQRWMYIVRFNGQKWSSIPFPRNLINRDFKTTAFELVEKGNEIIIAVGTSKQGIILQDKGKWSTITGKNGLVNDSINGLTWLDGKLFAATDEGLSVVDLTGSSGNYRVDNRWNEILKQGLAPGSSLCIYAINIERKELYGQVKFKTDRLWMHGHRWFGYIENGIFKPVNFQPDVDLAALGEDTGIFPDYKGGVYVSYFIRNYYFDYIGGIVQTVGIKNGLTGEGSSSMFVDFEKNMWVASRRGVSKIVSRRFTNYQMKEGLMEDEVTAVVEYRPGKFAFGHNNCLTFFDGEKFYPRRFPIYKDTDILQQRVLDLKVDSKYKLWVALSNAPLIETDFPGKIRYWGANEGLTFPAYCLWIDRDDEMLVGTKQGLFKRVDGRFVMEKMGNLPLPVTRKIFKSPASDIYLATSNYGLYVFENQNQRWVNFTNKNDPYANDIYSVFKDRAGRVLIGSLSGLYILENRRIKKFFENDFQVNRPVYFILEDNDHRLWFGLDNGVIRWDGKKAVRYSTMDGLAGQETNRAGGMVDSKGRLWIGTDRGVSMYNSSMEYSEGVSPPPKVRLLTLQTPSEIISLPGQKKIELPYKDNNITFSFRAVSFLDEKSIRYRYKLDGYDSEWRETANPFYPQVDYRNVRPGKYRFLLKAKNVRETWSPVISSPWVIIVKPFYQRWWFYFLLLAAVMMVLFGFHRYFADKKYARLLEEEVKERNRELKATEEKYYTLFQETKDTVYISTKEGRFIDINPSGVELFGYSSKEEILAADIAHDLYTDPQDREKFQAEIEKNGYVKDYLLPVRRKDGKPLMVLLTVSAVRGENGETILYRGIIRDMTHQKMLEQQVERMQKMEAIGTLAGGVAHDLNNILIGLTSYPELLLMQIPSDSPLRKPLLTIKRTGEKAGAVVQDLLTLSRRGVSVNEVVNLNDIVRDYFASPEWDKLKSYHPQVRLIIHTTSNLSNVMGSPIHLLKTLMNMVSNAAEAMPDGGVIKVETQNLAVKQVIKGFDSIPGGTYVVLKVSDTGVGITPEDIPKIFEPFYTKKKMGRSGTGLGMPVIWATVKDHNGFIDVRSEVGHGTAFELYFPTTSNRAVKKDEVVSIDRYRGNERVLIIDDVPEQREVASRILASLGYFVTAVSSGEEAVAYMQTDTVDLLVIDMILENGISSLEAYRRILESNPRQRAILVSGFSETAEVKEMQRLGAGIYLKKPYSIEQLGRAVRHELDQG